MRPFVAAVLAAALASGCAAGEDNSSAGGECDEALNAAATSPSPEQREASLTSSLVSCKDYDTWLATTERHPTALEDADGHRRDAEAYARETCA